MTPPSSHDPRLARDVAKQLDRRRTKRKLTLWTALAGLIAAGAMYLRCGGGFGLGGQGPGGGDDAAATQPAKAPTRCAIRVTKAGITVDGKPYKRDTAVTACLDQKVKGVDVVVTGDAREGDWTDLYASLVTAGITDIAVHKPGAGSNNPDRH